MNVHPSVFAKTKPDHLAYKVFPSGEEVTYRQLNERSNQVAHLMRNLGLKRGDVISILLENHPKYYEVSWAADRSGLYYTGLSTRFSAKEAAYIVKDSGTQILFTSQAMLELAKGVIALLPDVKLFVVDGEVPDDIDYIKARDKEPIEPIADESQGAPMLYSSGTTGQPKGVKFDLPEQSVFDLDSLTGIAKKWFNFNEDMIYLSPAPMYHSAPLRWSMSVQKIGGTVVVMEKFDPEYALQLIQVEKITHSQWVPTHFVRMLKLPVAVREQYDLSTHELTFHAAAPCPVLVKEQMIEWWGPMIHEFYAGTEFNGLTAITPEEWLEHKGSVGKAAFGTIHIMSDSHEELPPHKAGLIYFEGGNEFSYHNDPEKTKSAYDENGWSTLGDIGRVDEDGYLYLTDRKSFMIITGGVNIYPQEIEDAIITHPQVEDVAVIGGPDEDLGEKVIAVVQPLTMDDADDELAESIRQHILATLGKNKLPRQIDFNPELPRHATGKLYKRLLRDQYWENAKSAK